MVLHCSFPHVKSPGTFYDIAHALSCLLSANAVCLDLLLSRKDKQSFLIPFLFFTLWNVLDANTKDTWSNTENVVLLD